MAKGGDKARVAQNAAHLRKLQLLIAGANVSADRIAPRLGGGAAALASCFGCLLASAGRPGCCLAAWMVDRAPSRLLVSPDERSH